VAHGGPQRQAGPKSTSRCDAAGPQKKDRRRCRSRPASFVARSKADAAAMSRQPRTPNEETTMRFMVLVKADADSEAGVLPDAKLLEEMGRYNEELIKAGVMLDGNGLMASSKGARVRFSGNQRTVKDGPFAEAKELIAGYWIFQCRSKEECIEWVKRCPNPMGGESEIEIRQVFEASDFPEVPPNVQKLYDEAEAKRGTKA
jgi:hypothetical protein